MSPSEGYCPATGAIPPLSACFVPFAIFVLFYFYFDVALTPATAA